jgi:hypothetical protein
MLGELSFLAYNTCTNARSNTRQRHIFFWQKTLENLFSLTEYLSHVYNKATAKAPTIPMTLMPTMLAAPVNWPGWPVPVGVPVALGLDELALGAPLGTGRLSRAAGSGSTSLGGGSGGGSGARSGAGRRIIDLALDGGFLDRVGGDEGGDLESEFGRAGRLAVLVLEGLAGHLGEVDAIGGGDLETADCIKFCCLR